jgi:uncharacterized protein (TIGR03086 family)
MTNELHTHLTVAAAEAARVAHAVRAEHLGGPTPCGEYDVRALANHLVLWTSHSFAARARGASVSDELQRRDFTAEPSWADAYRTQLDAALAAWADPAVWDRELDMGGTPMPASAIATMILLEFALHGWDLARAVGEEYVLAESTAQAVLAATEEYAEMYRQYKGFAEPVPVAAAAQPFSRALALSGRDPAWRA